MLSTMADSDKSKEIDRAMGSTLLRLKNRIQNFEGDGSVRVFLTIVKQAAFMVSWRNVKTLGICKCEISGAARERVWN